MIEAIDGYCETEPVSFAVVIDEWSRVLEQVGTMKIIDSSYKMTFFSEAAGDLVELVDFPAF